MLDRRRALQGGLAAVGALSIDAPRLARAQRKPAAKVRYNEVVRSILYAPAYVALSKGYFTEAGLDITMATAQGGDKSMAALLGNNADIALMGPESPIYILTGELPTKVRIFCGSTSPTASCWSAARRSTSSTGACSRARRFSASVRAARRSCFSKPRCARTASIRTRT